MLSHSQLHLHSQPCSAHQTLLSLPQQPLFLLRLLQAAHLQSIPHSQRVSLPILGPSARRPPLSHPLLRLALIFIRAARGGAMLCFFIYHLLSHLGPVYIAIFTLLSCWDPNILVLVQCQRSPTFNFIHAHSSPCSNSVREKNSWHDLWRDDRYH